MSDEEPELVYAPVAVSGDDWDYQGLTEELQSYLREVGTPEELRIREARLLFEFSEILRSVPAGSLSDEQRFFVKETMTLMRSHLTKLRAQAEWAVAMLAREGYRYDADARRFERMDGFSKMRRHRFADEVVDAYCRAGSPGNTRAVRVKISAVLRGDYPDAMLSPRVYFPIWHCLEEHLARAKALSSGD